MTTYTVNMAACDEVASEIGVISAGIERMLMELNRAIGNLLVDWSAESKDNGYMQAQINWNNAAADMQRQAMNARNALSSIVNNYYHAERQGLNIWG